MVEPPHEAVVSLDDYSLDHWEKGQQKRRHLWHTVVYQKGTWATVFAAYQEWALQGWSGAWGPPRFKLVRFRKASGKWRRSSHFNVQQHHLVDLMDACSRGLRTRHETGDA